MKSSEINPKQRMEQILKDNDIELNKIPTPLDQEIILDPSKSIMSKTNPKGIIEYANSYFIDISGYEEFELMGQPHNVIRHPDMPKVIFKIMWEELRKGNNMNAFVKNLAKDGRYYWVIVNFEIQYDENGEVKSYIANRKAAPSHAISRVSKLYNKLRAIEINQNVTVAYKYFKGLLEEEQKDYDEYIASLLDIEKNVITAYFEGDKPKKKGFFSRLFK